MSDIPRNAPCPCGSGEKYKKCCLTRDEEARRKSAPPPSPHERARRLHDLDGRVTEHLQSRARALGERAVEALLAPLDALLFDEPGDAWVQLEVPFLVHHARLGDGRTIAERYLLDRGPSLPAAEREWLVAQSRSWFGLWDLLVVEPHAGLRLRDRLSGEERFVVEKKGAAVLTPRTGILGRVVDHDGVSVLCGIHPRPLPPEGLDDVERAVREQLRRKRKAIEPERLRSQEAVLLLVDEWESACADLDERPPPRMQNTDGEPLVLCSDEFAFHRGREDAVAAALLRVTGCSADEEETPARGSRQFTIHVEGNRMHATWDNTVLAHLTLDAAAGRLAVETNSVARADRVRALVEEVGRDGLLRHERRTAKDAGALLEEVQRQVGAQPPARGARADLKEVPTTEMVAALRDAKGRYYAAWIDEPVPALDGKTPREAAETRAGKARLAALLRAMEFHEGKNPEWERFDVGALRRTLGVEE